MLDAYLRKGAQLPTQSGSDISRRVIEDAITSTLFTPLRFMKPSDVSEILSLLVGTTDVRAPESSEVTLWRKFPVASGYQNTRFVEPDIVIDLHSADAEARTVIEIKWDDRLQREQLQVQVGNCASDIKAGTIFRHLSIVKTADLEALNYPGTRVRQWAGILRDLRNLRSEPISQGYSKIVLAWCLDAARLLHRLGIGTFEGLGNVPLRIVHRGVSSPVFQRFAWADLKGVIAMSNSPISLAGKSCL